MEYTFISRDTFNGIIERYIGNLPTSKQEKALINLNFLNKIKEVLLDPKNNTISNKNTRSWIKKKFKLEEITPGDYRVIVAANNNPVLAVENMYEVLCRTHAEITQHGWQRQTWKSIIERWGWIKQDIVEQFVNNCTICAVQKPSFHPLAAKPIIARNFLSRVQMDLIDLSFDADGEYKYICHVRDHFTRFSWARALTSKRAIEVAAYLFELFHFLGSPPTILQSDNGKEFCVGVIKELIEMWPTVKIINGRPRHPQSQGLVERANGILQQKLGKWRENTGRTDWSFGLKFVISAMNNSWCRSHKKTPYELVYGDKPRGNCTLIDELFAKNICNEEDIPDTIQIYDSIEDLDSDIIDDLQESNIPVQQLDIERAVVQDQDNENNRHIVLIDPVLLDITNNTQHEVLRNMARQDLQDYTNKMANQMSKGRKRIKEYQIGDLVRVAVPKIDRFSVDRPTLPCKIMEKTENNKYSLGSKFGIIGVYYSASELEPLGTETFPELEVIPLNKISIREAARLQSAGLVSGGICNCKGECNSNKCRCKKAGGDCSSRCHSGRSCQNK
ncbi:unnamed protein product [Rhizophagus irregularis]|nr:unnamed protein product [Rhizophagus irregularis]